MINLLTFTNVISIIGLLFLLVVEGYLIEQKLPTITMRYQTALAKIIPIVYQKTVRTILLIAGIIITFLIPFDRNVQAIIVGIWVHLNGN